MKIVIYLIMSLAIFYSNPVLFAQSINRSNSQPPFSDSLITCFLAGRQIKNISSYNRNETDNIDRNGSRLLLSDSRNEFLLNDIRPVFDKAINMSLIPNVISGKNAEPVQSSNKSEHFLNKNLLYFLGAAAIAVTVYLVWPKKESPANSNTTFGVPPLPH